MNLLNIQVSTGMRLVQTKIKESQTSSPNLSYRQGIPIWAHI